MADRRTAAAASIGDRNLLLLLELLSTASEGTMTLVELRDRGVRSPSDAAYTLQLSGHAIDRVVCDGPGGTRLPAYRLHPTKGAVTTPLGLVPRRWRRPRVTSHVPRPDKHR